MASEVDLSVMKCVIPNTSIVPNRISIGNIYYRDKNLVLDGGRLVKGKVNKVEYGLFYTDPLLTDYAGIAELDLMKEVRTNEQSVC